MRYTQFSRCKQGLPHDLSTTHEDQKIKCEVCRLCNRKFRWHKSFKGRINNQAYLAAHIRNFAQKFGATKQTYYKVYFPEKTVIKL